MTTPSSTTVDTFGTPSLNAHGVTATITTSAGVDGAVLVFLDTEFAPDGSDGPGLRVLVNDHPTYVGVDYEAVHECVWGVCDSGYDTDYEPSTDHGHVEQCLHCARYRTVEDPNEQRNRVITEIRRRNLDYLTVDIAGADAARWAAEMVVTGPNGHCATYDPADWSSMIVGTDQPAHDPAVEPTGLPATVTDVAQIVDTIAHIAWRQPGPTTA